MRTVETKVYTFKELTKEVQAKVLDKFRGVLVEDSWWYESEIDNFVEEASKIGFIIDGKSVCFDLDRGAYFGITKHGVCIDDAWVKNKLKTKSAIDLDITFRVGKVGMFHQEFPRDCWNKSTGNDKGWYELHIDLGSRLKAKIEPLVEVMLHNLCELCDEFFNNLGDAYSANQEDAAVQDFIEANDYEFEEDGTRVRR